MKINKFVLSIPTILLLSGCAMSPPVLQATRPLIEQPLPTKSVNVLPKSLNEVMESQYQGYSGQYKNIEFTLGQKYTSALGQLCRTVFFTESAQPTKQERRSICKNANLEWVIIPQVIKNKNSQIHFGA